MNDEKDLFTTEEASQELIDLNTQYVENEKEYSEEALKEMQEYVEGGDSDGE